MIWRIFDIGLLQTWTIYEVPKNSINLIDSTYSFIHAKNHLFINIIQILVKQICFVVIGFDSS